MSLNSTVCNNIEGKLEVSIQNAGSNWREQEGPDLGNNSIVILVQRGISKQGIIAALIRVVHKNWVGESCVLGGEGGNLDFKWEGIGNSLTDNGSCYVGRARINANSGQMVANTIQVASCKEWASNWIARCANSSLAGVALSTIVYCAGRTIEFGRIAALSCQRVANSKGVALIGGVAGNVGRRNAFSREALVVQSAGVRVAAICSIRFEGLAAFSSCIVANSNIVAIVESSANDRVISNANTSFTVILFAAEVVVITCCSVGFVWIIAFSC
jgi:hypothetical protein